MRPARLFTASVARIVVLAVAVGASVTLPVLTPSMAAPRRVASAVSAFKVTGTGRAALVHHTVSTNTSSSAKVPSIVRGTHAFHVKGRRWGDIGHQFPVERFGRAREGRKFTIRGMTVCGASDVRPRQPLRAPEQVDYVLG